MMTKISNEKSGINDAVPYRGITVFGLVESFILAVLLLTSCGLYISPETFNPNQLDVGNSYIFETYRIVRFPVILYVILNFKDVLSCSKDNITIIVFIIIFFASAAWSVAPVNTIGAASNIFIFFGFISSFVKKHGVTRATQFTWCVLAVTVMISVVLGGVGSRYAINDAGPTIGMWRGVFETKNTFGGICGILIVYTLYAKPIAQINHIIRLSVIAACIVGLAGSWSVGGIMGTTVAILYVFMEKSQNYFGRKLIFLKYVILAMSAVVVNIIFSNFEDIANLLGRDLTFGGRTKLWDAVLPLTFNAPFGSGYGTAGGDEAINLLSTAINSSLVRAIDNAYLVLALDLGWLMVAAYLVFLLWYILTPLEKSRSSVIGEHAISSIGIYQASRAFVETGSGPYPRISFFILLLLIISSKQIITTSHQLAPRLPNKLRGVP